MRDDIDLMESIIRRALVCEGVAQAKKLYMDTHKIPEHTFEQLLEKDPTEQKKYIEWMCKSYIAGNRTISQYDVIADFDNLLSRNKIEPQKRDINKYKTPEQVYDVVKYYEVQEPSKSQLQKQVKTNEAVKVFENDNAVVVKPLSKDASVCYGAGTKWCTSASSSHNYFNTYFYNAKVTLYYVIAKKDAPSNYDKVAVAVYPNGVKECFLADDQSISYDKIQPYFKELGIPV
jgi:hypothetical protein